MAVLIHEQEGQSLVNPYQQQQQSISDMSKYHPFHVIRRVGIISACLYGLHRYQVYHIILHSPNIHHGWFKAGLATSIGKYYYYYYYSWNYLSHTLSQTNLFLHSTITSLAILAMKAYIEMYAGKIKKQTINYQTFRNSTHAIMLLTLLTTICFYAALIPQFGWGPTALICNIIGFGVLLPFALLVPTYVQNIVGVVLMTFFIQEYI